jgi:DNA-binding transcriptional LysR family regulator
MHAPAQADRAAVSDFSHRSPDPLETLQGSIADAVIILPDMLSLLEQGKLVRLLPCWYGDAGMISMYLPSRAGMPTKTRVFVDFIAEACLHSDLARRFGGRAP